MLFALTGLQFTEGSSPTLLCQLFFYPQCNALVHSTQKSRRTDFSPGFQQLDLCLALKETPRVFSVSANLPAASGIEPLTACSCCRKCRAESGSIDHRLAPSGVQHECERGQENKARHARTKTGGNRSEASSLLTPETV